MENKNTFAMAFAGIAMCFAGYATYQNHTLAESINSDKKLALKANERALKKENLSRAKVVISQEPRIANIINYEMNQKSRYVLDSVLAEKTLSLAYEITNDRIEDSYYGSLADVGFSKEVVRTEQGYNIRGKWTMFVKPESPFYKKFPAGSAMVYHNESIPFMTCQTEVRPTILFAPLSASNNYFDAQFLEDKIQGAYRVTFSGNFDAIKDRLIVKVFCPLPIESDTKKLEDQQHIKNQKH